LRDVIRKWLYVPILQGAWRYVCVACVGVCCVLSAEQCLLSVGLLFCLKSCKRRLIKIFFDSHNIVGKILSIIIGSYFCPRVSCCSVFGQFVLLVNGGRFLKIFFNNDLLARNGNYVQSQFVFRNVSLSLYATSYISICELINIHFTDIDCSRFIIFTIIKKDCEINFVLY